MRQFLIILASAIVAAENAGAISFGQLDTFDVGEQGWQSSFEFPPGNNATNPNAPTVVMGSDLGGNALKITGSGNPGPGGRPTAFNAAQWGGDYLAAGINGIQMDIAGDAGNQGALSLRILLASFTTDGSPVGVFFSDTPVVVNPGEVVTGAMFSLAAPDLVDMLDLNMIGTSDYEAALASILVVRIFHDPDGTGARIGGAVGFGTPPPELAAMFQIDNVGTTGPGPIPEPGTALLVGIGLLALATRRRAARG